MSHQPPILGNQENPTNRHKYTIGRNSSTINHPGSTHLDAFVLGMDSQPKHYMAETGRRKKPSAISLPTYRVNDQDLAITDCKSLYDLTTRTAIPNCQEFRTQLLARSIKDIMSEGIRLHWVHSGAQLADALTKVMEANFLRETLRNGFYCLHDSEEVLKNRASNRNRLKWLRTATDQKCPKSEKL